ncbi:RNA polymerase sigma factor [Brevibacillus thermoruber]|uniref:RNA polymerase sigma factor n=1 Tax=Brevibacillus thermoruber TaxID=33942 RepID=UPI002FDD3894
MDLIEKSVVLLRFYQDYTLKDIAQMLELPLGTTKTILYRALEKLRGILREEESS